MPEILRINPDTLAWRCVTAKACGDCAVASYLASVEATDSDKNNACSTFFARSNYESIVKMSIAAPGSKENAASKLKEMRTQESGLHNAIDLNKGNDCDQSNNPPRDQARTSENSPSNRTGNVERETQKWISREPDNKLLAIAARNVRGYTNAWIIGEITAADALHKAIDLYQLWDEDGSVDETTMALLSQAKMWMGYEMDVSLDSYLGQEIENRYINGTKRIVR